MAKSSYQSKKDRMDRLLGLLKAEDHCTSLSLAKKLRVSHRTLMRDLEELKASGIPIEADRGRGGGLRLNAQWGLGRLQLNYKESLDLLLSLAIAERFNSPVLLSNVKSLRDKVFQSFPQEHRKKLQLIRKRVHITTYAAESVRVTYDEVPAHVQNSLHEAFFEMRCLKIAYCDEKKNITERLIEPHYLLLSFPIWYIMAWDHLRQDLRAFRVDRIQKASVHAQETFHMHHQDLFQKTLQKFSESL
ncbi:helix-turn-helix transcriptional regulator [Bdellovibrio bacteriovorus]|uniref:helix-turn-helix transcriptional regulator n=1 Tax=Bdellovibrio bacteriovorus TaxID=959 RepID=UPI0035A6DFFF